MHMHTKRFLFLAIALFLAVVAPAQTLQEVVYLKNGSVIRGTIIEQVPNVSLRIQTSDGSIFAYPMDEVEKITKEETVAPYGRQKSASKMNEYGLPSGYRGFIDFGYSVGVGDFGEGRVEFSTTHGYQIIPYLFLGVGVGVAYYHDSDLLEIPLFADIRASIPASRVCQPFLDWKIGYTVYDADGFYMCPSIGCRFALSNMAGASVSIGYTYQSFEYWLGIRHNCGGLTFKVAFDF